MGASTASPLIGITPCIDRGRRLRPGRDYLYIARDYSSAVAAAGGTPVLLTPDTPAREIGRFAALVISGGDDLPRSFQSSSAGGAGEQESTLGAAEDAERIRWERELLEGCFGERIPVLGLCYGMQLINLHRGGTLYRDVRGEHAGALDHGGSGVVTRHEVEREGESEWLGELPGRFFVNSSHGQAVERLGAGLRATVRGVDGVLEGFEGDGVCGVEWHPETDAETGKVVFGALIRAAREREVLR